VCSEEAPIDVAAVITVDPVDGTRSAGRSGDRVLVIGGKLAGRLAPKTYGSRATCAAPAKWSRTVGTPEGPHEVARVSEAAPPADLLYRKIGFDQQTPRLCHAALGDPLLNRSPRLAPNHRGGIVTALVAERLCASPYERGVFHIEQLLEPVELFGQVADRGLTVDLEDGRF
jgi:hypothetical protein